MEKFNNGRRFPESAFNIDSNMNIYVEIRNELKKIMVDMANLEPKLEPKLKKSVIDRMIAGPEMSLPDPELAVFFEQIAAVEEKYGREHVAELAAFYDAPAVT